MNPPLLNSLAARDIANVLHPVTDLKTHLEVGPVVISRGEGVRVFDDAGKGYIEAVAGLWCAALGFSNERLVQAAANQMRKLPFYHGFTAKSHEPMIDLAEMLIQRAPVPMSKAFFANSGSEANDSAIKMIWYFNNAVGRPQKKKIIGRVKGYHGITLAAASLTGINNYHRSFDAPLPGFIHTMAPHWYSGALDGETEEQFATRCADELEKLILAEGPDTVAAMWAEPVMGAGGVIVPPKGYFEKIQAVLRKYDVLLVADEVICGFGRTGNWWGHETLGFTPDMVSMAKGLSSGYVPIAAVAFGARVGEAIFQGEKEYAHGVTYAGHPVCAAVALENLRIMESQTLGMQPDILTCAKALSSSYLPISAVLVNERIFQALADESNKIGTFAHGYTYSGHPVPAAVAVETLKIYDEIKIGDHVRHVGPIMQAELKRRFADHPLVGEVRGVGLVAAIELVADKASRKSSTRRTRSAPGW